MVTRITLITVLITTLPACSFLGDWVIGSTDWFRDNSQPEEFIKSINGINVCAYCGKATGTRSTTAPIHITTRVRHYGSRYRSYRPPVWTEPGGAFIIGGKWSDDLCYDCNKERMDAFKKRNEERDRKKHLEQTEQAYRRMWAMLTGK